MKAHEHELRTIRANKRKKDHVVEKRYQTQSATLLVPQLTVEKDNLINKANSKMLETTTDQAQGGVSIFLEPQETTFKLSLSISALSTPTLRQKMHASRITKDLALSKTFVTKRLNKAPQEARTTQAKTNTLVSD